MRRSAENPHADSVLRLKSLPTRHRPLQAGLCGLAILWSLVMQAAWNRHVIDDSSEGADGVRLADVNGDGYPDIATGWEEGGEVRIYLHTGPDHVKARWPAATVGKVASPEDAVFADFQGQGRMDVVSSCEGKTQSVFFHWAPENKQDYLDPTKWTTQAIPCLAGESMWMFASPMHVNQDGRLDLVLGAKGQAAQVGWLKAPPNPKDVDQWTWNSIYEAGWIMSIMRFDPDQDGDHDILLSDRKGPRSGVLWLENRLNDPDPGWKEHRIGPIGQEVLFLDWLADTQGMTVWVAVKPNQIRQLRAASAFSHAWDMQSYAMPDWMGRSKAVRHGDINADGHPDLVVSCEGASDGKSGVAWFTPSTPSRQSAPMFHDIAGADGVKFDRIEILDLDGDGDVDVMTCEERDGLGVIWYENPLK